MQLISIWIGTLIAGIGSVWIAAALSFGLLMRYTQHLLSLAAGALLATAFMHLLPEAFESGVEPHDLFMTLLAGLVLFFLLDKAELWHHGHEHHHCDQPERHDTAQAAATKLVTPAPARTYRYAPQKTALPVSGGHAHHGHDHAHPPGSWAVLVGDSLHCFGDGILIAAAFIANWQLGVMATLAVLAHEVPHHMGDLVVLRGGSGGSQRIALVKVSMAGAVTALGGTVGYLLVDQLHGYLPYFLTITSSSFIYVALADLIPQLQKRLTARETVMQIVWLGMGIALVTAVGQFADNH